MPLRASATCSASTGTSSTRYSAINRSMASSADGPSPTCMTRNVSISVLQELTGSPSRGSRLNRSGSGSSLLTAPGAEVSTTTFKGAAAPARRKAGPRDGVGGEPPQLLDHRARLRVPCCPVLLQLLLRLQE